MNRRKEEKLLILGCGGHAKVITDIAKSLGINDFYYQDINIEINKFLGNITFVFQILLVIFNVAIFVISKRESYQKLINSENNLDNVNIIT